MTEQPVIYMLDVAPDGDKVRGILYTSSEEIANFEFALERANDLGADLRHAAATWAEARENGSLAEPDLWQTLHEMASRCFHWIFRDVLWKVEKCLAEAPPGAEIWVRQQTSSLSMPWGLLCTESDAQLTRISPSQPVLWSAKYNLRTRLRHGEANLHRDDRWGFEAVVCKPTYALDSRPLRPEATPLAQAILARSLDHDSPERAPEAPPNCFVYMHAHSASEGRELVFKSFDGGIEYCRDPMEILDKITPQDSGVAVLVVLNACESARAFESMGATLAKHSTNIEVACIATEFPVDRGFATEFGLELIDRCVQQGESSYAAMKILRLKHYPLSIIYSHYCKSDLTAGEPVQVFKDCDVAAYRAATEHINYSDRLGSVPQ